VLLQKEIKIFKNIFNLRISEKFNDRQHIFVGLLKVGATNVNKFEIFTHGRNILAHLLLVSWGCEKKNLVAKTRLYSEIEEL